VLVGNYELRRWGSLQWHNAHTMFFENRSTFSKIEKGENTQRHDHMSMLSFIMKGVWPKKLFENRNGKRSE
jgi:hypothetical protein